MSNATGKTSVAVNAEEKKLKRVLGTRDVFGIAIGQIIGAGIMSLTGVAIGMTGTGVVLAFLLAGILTVITTMPVAQLGAALPTTGGQYRYASRLLGKKWGAFYAYVFLFSQVGLAMFATSFAQYFVGLIPGVSVKLIAFLLITIIFISNYFGTKMASTIQNILVILLIAGLGCFIIFGVGKANYSVVFTAKNMFPNGARGFLTAAALLCAATSGAGAVAEMGGEIKNPGRDIPLAIISTTLGIGVVYALIALVASGVLPWHDVMFKPLTDVARTILPGPLFIVFMVGGALGATATTLNATMTWCPKPLVIASQDGILPKWIGYVDEKSGVPRRMLILFYLVGLIPILIGMDIATIAAISNVLIALCSFLAPFAMMKLIRRYPEAYSKSGFKLPSKLMPVIAVVTLVIFLAQMYLLITTLTVLQEVLVIAGVVLALVLALAFGKKFDSAASTDF